MLLTDYYKHCSLKSLINLPNEITQRHAKETSDFVENMKCSTRSNTVADRGAKLGIQSGKGYEMVFQYVFGRGIRVNDASSSSTIRNKARIYCQQNGVLGSAGNGVGLFLGGVAGVILGIVVGASNGQPLTQAWSYGTQGAYLGHHAARTLGDVGRMVVMTLPQMAVERLGWFVGKVAGKLRAEPITPPFNLAPMDNAGKPIKILKNKSGNKFYLRNSGKRGTFGKLFFAVSDAGEPLAAKQLRLNGDGKKTRLTSDTARNAEVKLPRKTNLYMAPLETVMVKAKGKIKEYVFEPLMDGDLEDIKEAPLALIYEVIKQAAPECQRLHENTRHLHNDIKPQNIFYKIEKDKIIFAIGDFGSALPLQNGKAKARGGTPKFWSPEAFSPDGRTDRSNVYSLGLTILNLLAPELPFSLYPWDKGMPRDANGSIEWSQLSKETLIDNPLGQWIHDIVQDPHSERAELVKLVAEKFLAVAPEKRWRMSEVAKYFEAKQQTPDAERVVFNIFENLSKNDEKNAALSALNEFRMKSEMSPATSVAATS